MTFTGGRDGRLKRAEGGSSKTAEKILKMWEELDPAADGLLTTTLPMLLDDIRNAAEDYASIGGQQGLQALLGVIQNRNRGMKLTGTTTTIRMNRSVFLGRPLMRNILVVADDDVQKTFKKFMTAITIKFPVIAKTKRASRSSRKINAKRGRWA